MEVVVGDIINPDGIPRNPESETAGRASVSRDPEERHLEAEAEAAEETAPIENTAEKDSEAIKMDCRETALLVQSS